MSTASSTRRPLISGNWKMHHNHFEAIQVTQKLHYRLADHDFDEVEVSLHPPFTDLRSTQTVIGADRMKILLGAQNCHFEDQGAFTGEVAAPMLAKLEVSLVIVGHSERRQLFGETDDIVNAKLKAVLRSGMTPILCVGETLEQREAGEAEPVVEAQVRAGLEGVGVDEVSSAVVAYEPIWAIGTGRTATTEDAQGMCAHLRNVVASVAGSEPAASVRLQYGGSVKPGNIADLMAQPDIDGALVGGASLDADDFASICGYRRAG